MKNIESVLKLNKIVFDKIEFNRLGFKTLSIFLNLKSNLTYHKDQKRKFIR